MNATAGKGDACVPPRRAFAEWVEGRVLTATRQNIGHLTVYRPLLWCRMPDPERTTQAKVGMLSRRSGSVR